MTKVPLKIVQEIEREKFSTNNLIYYKAGVGWVYQRRDDDLINSTPQAAEYESGSSSEISYVMNPVIGARPLERLGPFGTQPTRISIAIIQGTNMYQTTFDHQLSHLAKYAKLDSLGQHAPMALVTLNSTARVVAHIPQEATHFCWVYPPVGLTQLSEARKAKIDQKVASGDSDLTFLVLGGFVYFQLEQCTFKTLQANCLVKADNGLVFEGPFNWRAEYTANLAKDGRFQDITIAELLEYGIKYYCFINPNEKLISSISGVSDWIPAPNGGFVYLYDSRREPHSLDRYFSVAGKPITEQISTRVMPFSLIRNQRRLTSAEKPANASPQTSSEKDSQFSCSICQERTVRCIFIPCKHMCTCTECAQRVRQQLHSVCPICRETFTEVWDVFL